MSYHEALSARWNDYLRWLDLRNEQGVDLAAEKEKVQRFLESAIRRIARMARPQDLAAREPDELDAIRRLRPDGPRRMHLKLTDAQLLDRLQGAWFGRAAGCILGIPCEGFSKQRIRDTCRTYGIKYPLRGYWPIEPKPERGLNARHYKTTPRKAFFGDGISYIGCDDDLIYTQLGLLILEEYGPDFTSADVGKAWVKYLPLACTAEKVALENLRAGLTPPKTATKDNPYTDWIGADIRSDPWGYAAPGWPERAAEFAHRDARVSHLATGIHGEMYFSAVIAAAFAVADPVEALRLGLTEVPSECRVAQAARDALTCCEKDGDWDATTDRILKKYEGMANAHTLNNLELTVAGIWYGAKDFGKTIALTVMGGVDTDCTGATAGSILGAVLGAKRLPKKWIAPLGNRVESYIIGKRNWRSDDIARRFLKVATKVLSAS